MSLLLKVIKNGEISYLPINQANLIIASQPGAVYTLVDETGDAITDNLELIRKEDELEILLNDETVATLDEFYVPGAEASNAPAYWVEGSITSDTTAGSTAIDIASLSSAQEGATVISGSDLAVNEGILWSSSTSTAVATSAGFTFTSTHLLYAAGALAVGGVAVAASSSCNYRR